MDSIDPIGKSGKHRKHLGIKVFRTSRHTTDPTDVLLVKIGLGRELLYHLLNLLINQAMGIWDIYATDKRNPIPLRRGRGTVGSSGR